jgi:hypothetical protein
MDEGEISVSAWEKKWGWKMDWCSQQHLTPANNHFWRLAEEAWDSNCASLRRRLMNLRQPPTEIEIAELVEACNAVPAMGDIARRLAYNLHIEKEERIRYQKLWKDSERNMARNKQIQ